MRKFFFYLLAATAMCAGYASCSSEDDDPVKDDEKVVLETPKFAEFAAKYSYNGTSLELTESGDYIYQTAPVRSTELVIKTGKYTVNGKTITLTGDVTGSFNAGQETVSVSANGVSLNVALEKNTPEISDVAKKFSRSWKVEPKAEYNSLSVNITDAAYAKIFGEYGYPKRIIITALGTFYLECSKQTCAGKWQVSGNFFKVAGAFIDPTVNYSIDKKVKVTLAFVDGTSTEKVTVTLTEEK